MFLILLCFFAVLLFKTKKNYLKTSQESPKRKKKTEIKTISSELHSVSIQQLELNVPCVGSSNFLFVFRLIASERKAQVLVLVSTFERFARCFTVCSSTDE